ncbi:hypothetical protein DAPPUDRAFT_119845 [Daphnia pulex]|uniref:Zinc finger PHD-type domain-containing protein n=1 Tax=Daphnia pulex TaxID=6669 RepID=E9HZM5_DAPPU|nr:hypothetical protein DAPPUDRAFT_119845 [Daphnia pulex]|eukprot:EFX62806.1 hypothetical protein DAPPUDRAFT_119845 [Daphnia pulex]
MAQTAEKVCIVCNSGFPGRVIQFVSCVDCKGPVHLTCIPGNKRGKVLSKATYVLMNKNNEAFFYKCSKCPTVPVPEIRVNLMAQVTEVVDVVENSRTTLAATFKLILGPLHSSPKKDLHPKPRTDATDIIPFTPIDGDCRPIITPEIELADAFAGLPMISTNEEVNLPMEQGSNSLLERQMATLEDSERYNESAQPNSPMELTSFFARPVATQESSLPSLAQERSRDRSNRSINGIRKWHIEPAAGKRLKPMLIDDTDRGLGIRYTRKNGTVMWRCNFRPKKNPCHGLVSQIGDKFAEHHPHSCNPKSHHKVNVILAAEAKKYALDHLNEPAQKVVEPLIVKVLDGNPNWNPINPTTLARAVNRRGSRCRSEKAPNIHDGRTNFRFENCSKMSYPEKLDGKQLLKAVSEVYCETNFLNEAFCYDDDKDDLNNSNNTQQRKKDHSKFQLQKRYLNVRQKMRKYHVQRYFRNDSQNNTDGNEEWEGTVCK